MGNNLCKRIETTTEQRMKSMQYCTIEHFSTEQVKSKLFVHWVPEIFHVFTSPDFFQNDFFPKIAGVQPIPSSLESDLI